MNLSKFPRRGYVQDNTPIDPAPAFSKALGGEVNIYIKRDDLLPGAAGGNKTRKLDFCIADALDKGADALITCGAIQSNHCRLTLSWAVKEGIPCYLVLEERVAGTYKPDGSGNNLLYQILGAKGISVVPDGTDIEAEMEKLAGKLRNEGKTPYIIPGGASNEIGALGYVTCAEETMLQLNKLGLAIDNIIVPSGSTGTHAGMIVGLYGNNVNIPVHGINVGRSKEEQEILVKTLVDKTSIKVGLKTEIPQAAVLCYDEYVGPGYSISTQEMIDAVKLLARTEAILLDPVYSGKTMAGLIGLLRKGVFAKGSNLLFLHTGGSPALYVYKDEFFN